MYLYLTLAIALVFSSCTNQPKELNSMADIMRINGKLPQAKATVFVHVPASIQTLRGKLTVDGQTVASLPNRSFTKLSLSPGVHKLDIEFSAITGPNCENYRYNFQKGIVYHIALKDAPQIQSLGTLLVGRIIYPAVHLRPIEAIEGIQLSRCENYIPASR